MVFVKGYDYKFAAVYEHDCTAHIRVYAQNRVVYVEIKTLLLIEIDLILFLVKSIRVNGHQIIFIKS